MGRWLLKLCKFQTGDENPSAAWLAQTFPNYNSKNPAGSYAEIMRQLFPLPQERQREIERITQGKDPGFGYATLAQILTHETCGARCNLVLTTNFDDMVADALYLFTQKKPLVIVHESLVGFVETGRTRPVVIKLHGDAMLAPKNTAEETFELDPKLASVLAEQLSKRGLIFLGYGGNDKSITGFLKSLPPSALSSGIYWVNEHIPDNEFGLWLQEHPRTTWVKHVDFDELMLLIRAEFNLAHPDSKRFEALITRYQDTFAELSQRIQNRPATDTKSALSSAVEKASADFKNWFAVELEAQKHKSTDPEEADRIYWEGLKHFPKSAELLCNYAVFLSEVRKDMDQAESYYRRAIEADPNHAVILGSYALFLSDVRKDMDQAESYYRRAIEADPNHTNNLGIYAVFLSDVRKDMDQAELFYRRAIEADPNHANTLGNYATFLKNVRKDMEQAESYYRRAIEADPNHTNNLGNYAGFLLAQGKLEEGMELLERAMAGAKIPADEALLAECLFYAYANGPEAQREPSLTQLRALLDRGVRSSGWDFSANIERAKKAKHPRVRLLLELAQVISEGADISSVNWNT